MKYIVLILALMFAVPVFAQDTTATEELTIEIAKMSDAEKEKALNAIRADESDTAARAREWVEIGNGLGDGLAATAQKMGVVANEFAQSPVGKMAMLLIIWNYMGETISGWICGFGLLMIGLPFWLYNFRKTFGVYNDKGKFLHYDKDMFSDNGRHATIAWIYILALLFIAVASIIFIA
jgi:hypothetical protein